MQEAIDGHLVGGDQHGRGPAARQARLACDPQSRESSLVRRAEVQPRDGHEVWWRRRGRETLGVRQGVLDRETHVRGTQLCLQRTVDEHDGRVDHALRMDDDIDRVVVDIVQPVCLDDLQALVGQRRRVDGDLGSHGPGRVPQGLLRGDRSQLVRGGIEERTARCGEHEPCDPGRRFTDQALPDGGVLRVDRPQPGERRGERVARVRCRTRRGQARRLGHDEVAARDERLLVGGRHDLAGAQRSQDGPQRDHAARTDDDDVHVVPGGEGHEGSVSAHADDARRQVELHVLVRQRHGSRAQASCLGLQLRRVAPRRQRHHAETIRMALEHLHGLEADAAGRPEQRDAETPVLSQRGPGHRAQPRGPRTGRSRCGPGCRRDPGSASLNPWRQPPA